MKVVVTGAGGQLGRDLLDAFAADDVVGLARADLDVTDEAAVVAALRDHRPDVVVHTAAVTDGDACENAPDVAWKVNATGTWWVARACRLSGAAMVYMSTSWVFDGEARRPYTEFDRPNPRSVYGRSKEAGEELVRQTLPAHYIVRTDWLMGSQGRLAEALLRGGGEVSAAEGVLGQQGSPTFTFDLAPAIRRLAVSGRHGTYHLTNAGTCTGHELAAAVSVISGIDLRGESFDAASPSASALRPRSVVLDNLQARLTGLPALPAWRRSLDRFVAHLLDRPRPESAKRPR